MKKLWIACIACCLAACTEHARKTFPAASNECICTLKENLDITGEVLSFCFVDSGHFAVASGGNATIQIYDMQGTQQRIIARQGRGKHEYVNPAIIRAFEGRLYVWCDSSLKFIVFSSDGEPLAEYRYPTAIKDFIPYKDKIVIYNAGGVSDRTIHLYDTESRSVVASFGHRTREHELLSVNRSTAPFLVENDSLYFMNLDELTIYGSALGNCAVTPLQRIESETFRVRKLPQEDLMNTDRMRAFAYLRENAYVDALYMVDSLFVVKTMEGQFEVSDNRVNNIDRHPVFYAVSDGERIGKQDVSWQSFSRAYLSAPFEDGVFYITNEADGDSDCYKLYRQNLGSFEN